MANDQPPEDPRTTTPRPERKPLGSHPGWVLVGIAVAIVVGAVTTWATLHASQQAIPSPTTPPSTFRAPNTPSAMSSPSAASSKSPAPSIRPQTSNLATVLSNPLDPGPIESSGSDTSGATASSVAQSPKAPTTIAASKPAPKYLTDLDYTTYSGDGVFAGPGISPGLVLMDGKKYPKSLTLSICDPGNASRIVVVLPSPGYTRLTGYVGYADNSFNKSGVTARIASFTTPLPQDKIPSDTPGVLDEIPLKSTPQKIDETLDPSVTALALLPDQYACSTTIAWADLMVS